MQKSWIIFYATDKSQLSMLWINVLFRTMFLLTYAKKEMKKFHDKFTLFPDYVYIISHFSLYWHTYETWFTSPWISLIMHYLRSVEIVNRHVENFGEVQQRQSQEKSDDSTNFRCQIQHRNEILIFAEI